MGFCQVLEQYKKIGYATILTKNSHFDKRKEDKITMFRYYHVYQETEFPNGYKEKERLKTNMTKAQAKVFMKKEASRTAKKWTREKYDLNLIMIDETLTGLRFQSKIRQNDIVRIRFSVKRMNVLEILNIR
jgi:hypothetical protein